MAEYDSGDDEVEDQEEEIGDQGMAISNGRSGFAQGKEAEQQDETDVSSPIHGRNSTTASNRHYRDSGGVTIDHSSGQRHSVCVDREPLAAIPKRKLLQRNQYVPQPPVGQWLLVATSASIVFLAEIKHEVHVCCQVLC